VTILTFYLFGAIIKENVSLRVGKRLAAEIDKKRGKEGENRQ
jgi:hypothetical protein